MYCAVFHGLAMCMLGNVLGVAQPTWFANAVCCKLYALNGELIRGMFT